MQNVGISQIDSLMQAFSADSLIHDHGPWKKLFCKHNIVMHGSSPHILRLYSGIDTATYIEITVESSYKNRVLRGS